MINYKRLSCDINNDINNIIDNIREDKQRGTLRHFLAFQNKQYSHVSKYVEVLALQVIMGSCLVVSV